MNACAIPRCARFSKTIAAIVRRPLRLYRCVTARCRSRWRRHRRRRRSLWRVAEGDGRYTCLGRCSAWRQASPPIPASETGTRITHRYLHTDPTHRSYTPILHTDPTHRSYTLILHTDPIYTRRSMQCTGVGSPTTHGLSQAYSCDHLDGRSIQCTGLVALPPMG